MTTTWTRAAVAVVAALAAAATAVVPLLAVEAQAQAHDTATAAPVLLRSAGASTLAWRATAPARIVIGRSRLGRDIVAVRRGSPTAGKVLLVLGQMHGSEPAGRAVAAKVAVLAPPAGLQVWIVSTMNPDGSVARRRTNARGVDLNRNFPYGWVRAVRSIYYPGPFRGSEPETRAMAVFLERLRPDLVVSLHQAFNSVDVSSAKTHVWAVRLATALKLRQVAVPCGTGPCHGTMTSWYNSTYVGAAITVELPRAVRPSWATYDARAILSVGALLVPPITTPTPTPTTTATASPSATASSVAS